MEEERVVCSIYTRYIRFILYTISKFFDDDMYVYFSFARSTRSMRFSRASSEA